MNWLRNKKTVAVHSGTFHADDAFAVAAISLHLGYIPKIIRTRDEETIKKADYVLDVGRVYDPENNKFDHHGEGWSEKRDNGILYATIGLVWKKFGEKICDSKEVAEVIDKNIIQGIDANDNGIAIYNYIFDDVKAYSIFDYIFSLNSTWKEDNHNDKSFEKAVKTALNILEREISRAKDFVEGKKEILAAYDRAHDKRILVLDKAYDYFGVVDDLSEPLFVISPKSKDGTWHINAIGLKGAMYKRRMDLPLAWAGKSGEELQKITEVKDAVFCHNKRFIAVAKSKEGAIRLAQLALLDNK